MRRRQAMLNIGANLISVIISLVISFLLTPFIVTNIGKEAYSFVPISNNFTAYMTILTIALTSMTSRFVTLKVHRNEMVLANEYLSTSFFVNLIVAVFCSVICIFIVVFLNKLINIPANIFNDIRLLFIIIFATFLVNISTTTFGVAAFCKNRLEVTSVISIVASLIRVVVILVLFRYFDPKVYYVGVSVFVVVAFTAVFNYITAKKIMPELKTSIKYFRPKIVWELFTSGMWNSFNQLSLVLLTGVDLLIANIMLGASAAAMLAIAKTAPMALQILIGVIPTTFSPYLTILFAKDSRDLFIKELMYTLKFTSIFSGTAIAIFIALSAHFFRLWVPSLASSELTILALLTMVSLIASFSIMPLFYIFTITNKLKWPSIVVFLEGMANIAIVFLLIKTTNFGLFAIAGISSFLELFRCLVFVPIYAAYCLKENRFLFYNSIVKSLIYIATLLFVFSGISIITPNQTWGSLLISISLMGISGLLIGVFFVLDKEDRMKMLTKLNGLIANLF